MLAWQRGGPPRRRQRSCRLPSHPGGRPRADAHLAASPASPRPPPGRLCSRAGAKAAAHSSIPTSTAPLGGASAIPRFAGRWRCSGRPLPRPPIFKMIPRPPPRPEKGALSRKEPSPPTCPHTWQRGVVLGLLRSPPAGAPSAPAEGPAACSGQPVVDPVYSSSAPFPRQLGPKRSQLGVGCAPVPRLKHLQARRWREQGRRGGRSAASLSRGVKDSQGI